MSLCLPRKLLAEATKGGEKCAKLRIIELAETINCNLACNLPVDCEVGEWGSWTSCSSTCGGGTKERERLKIADAKANGTKCVSTRMIPLTETNSCNSVHCPSVRPTSGVVSSPNHPSPYPHNLRKTERILVDGDKVVRLEFTDAAIWWDETCSNDYVIVTDGDGTLLMDKGCGYSDRSSSSEGYFKPPIITSQTNAVDIYFHTVSVSGASQKGWSLRWTAVTPGSK